MKRSLKVVILLFVTLIVLVGCRNAMIQESDSPGNAGVKTENSAYNNEIPEYVQQVHNKYAQVITQHGDLVAKTSAEIKDMREHRGLSYLFLLYPTEDVDIAKISRAEVYFDERGSQSVHISVDRFTRPYLEELLALSLLVIDPEIESHDIKEVVDRVLTSYYQKGKDEIQSEDVIVGDYKVHLIDMLVEGMIIVFQSNKTAFDVYDFDKTDYIPLTYDIFSNPADYINKQFYIEGTFDYAEDLKDEIVDEQGNHYLIKDEEYRCRRGDMYRIYGILKTDVYGKAYFQVEYPYGL